MKRNLNRRQFVKKGSRTAFACCAMIASAKFNSVNAFVFQDDKEEVLNPKALCYCGYKCPDDCEFLVATLENDVEKKKVVFEKWKLEEQHGIKFNAESIFCYKCKPEGNDPEGIILQHCTVRKCAIEKEYDCCIECKELVDCEKNLWARFPDFKKKMIEKQKKYLKA